MPLSNRYQAGLAIVSLSIALSAGRMLFLLDTQDGVDQDPIRWAELNLPSLPASLPPVKRIGYYTDLDWTSGTAQPTFYGVQNLIAPVIVENSVQHRWVIINLADPKKVDEVSAKLRLVSRRELRSGWWLGERQEGQ